VNSWRAQDAGTKEKGIKKKTENGFILNLNAGYALISFNLEGCRKAFKKEKSGITRVGEGGVKGQPASSIAENLSFFYRERVLAGERDRGTTENAERRGGGGKFRALRNNAIKVDHSSEPGPIVH